jgi:hypothetical protein
VDLTSFYAAYRVDGRGRAGYEPSVIVALILSVCEQCALVAGDRASLSVHGHTDVTNALLGRPGHDP